MKYVIFGGFLTLSASIIFSAIEITGAILKVYSPADRLALLVILIGLAIGIYGLCKKEKKDN